eukprot:2527771-Rhodomonas_salina.1
MEEHSKKVVEKIRSLMDYQVGPEQVDVEAGEGGEGQVSGAGAIEVSSQPPLARPGTLKRSNSHAELVKM